VCTQVCNLSFHKQLQCERCRSLHPNTQRSKKTLSPPITYACSQAPKPHLTSTNRVEPQVLECEPCDISFMFKKIYIYTRTLSNKVCSPTRTVLKRNTNTFIQNASCRCKMHEFFQELSLCFCREPLFIYYLYKD